MLQPIPFLFSFRNIQFKAPFKVEEKPRELLYTYLDTTGRPVVMATASNLVDQHIDEFDLSYQFESYLMFLEPLLVTGAIYLFFLSIVIIVRLDFTISEVQYTGLRCVCVCVCVYVHSLTPG